MESVWDERYSKPEFAYGEEPNLFFKEQIEKLSSGKLLLPAEGEGRNAVYAAKLKWQVSAFDTSMEAEKKASKLASKNAVSLDYRVGELSTLHFEKNSFDAMALIYAHFPLDLKSSIHKQLDQFVRSGGVVIFEAFSKKHLSYVKENPKVGGPKELGMLFSLEEIKSDFQNYKFLILEEKEVELHEGIFHNGLGSVIRFVAKKK